STWWNASFNTSAHTVWAMRGCPVSRSMISPRVSPSTSASSWSMVERGTCTPPRSTARSRSVFATVVPPIFGLVGFDTPPVDDTPAAPAGSLQVHGDPCGGALPPPAPSVAEHGAHELGEQPLRLHRFAPRRLGRSP